MAATKEQIIEQARLELNGLLAVNGMTQAELAGVMGVGVANLSNRLRGGRLDIYERIAYGYPPAGRLVAKMFLGLAKLHIELWRDQAEPAKKVLEDVVDELEELLQEGDF